MDKYKRAKMDTASMPNQSLIKAIDIEMFRKTYRKIDHGTYVCVVRSVTWSTNRILTGILGSQYEGHERYE